MTRKRFEKLFTQAREGLDYWVAGAIFDFTEEVVCLMEEKNITRSELAKKMGTSPAYITKVLRGSTNFTLASMVKLARALELEVRIRLVSVATGGPRLRQSSVIGYPSAAEDPRMIPELTKNRAALEEICRRHKVRRLELFGSAARGEGRSRKSDLDFLVEFEPLPFGRYADAYFGLLEDLEQLFGRPVDLVVDSAIKNPYFRESIERTKALVYAG